MYIHFESVKEGPNDTQQNEHAHTLNVDDPLCAVHQNIEYHHHQKGECGKKGTEKGTFRFLEYFMRFPISKCEQTENEQQCNDVHHICILDLEHRFILITFPFLLFPFIKVHFLSSTRSVYLMQHSVRSTDSNIQRHSRCDIDHQLIICDPYHFQLFCSLKSKSDAVGLEQRC